MGKILVLSIDPAEHLLYGNLPDNATHHTLEYTILKQNSSLFDYLKLQLNEHKYSHLYLCCSASHRDTIAHSYAQVRALHTVLKKIMYDFISIDNIVLDFSSYADYHFDRVTPLSYLRNKKNERASINKFLMNNLEILHKLKLNSKYYPYLPHLENIEAIKCVNTYDALEHIKQLEIFKILDTLKSDSDFNPYRFACNNLLNEINCHNSFVNKLAEINQYLNHTYAIDTVEYPTFHHVLQDDDKNLVKDLAPWGDESCPFDDSTISWNFSLIQKYSQTLKPSDELHFSIISSQYKGNRNPKKITANLDAIFAYCLFYNDLIFNKVTVTTIPYINRRVEKKQIATIVGDKPDAYLDHEVTHKNMIAHYIEHEKKHAGKSKTSYINYFLRSITYKPLLQRYWDYFIIGALLPPALIIISLFSIVWAKPALLNNIMRWSAITAIGGLPTAALAIACLASGIGIFCSHLLTKRYPRRGIGKYCYRDEASFIQRQWPFLAFGWAGAPAITAIALTIFRFADPTGFISMTSLVTQTFAEVGGIPFAISVLTVIASCVGLALSALVAKIANPIKKATPAQDDARLIPQSNSHTSSLNIASSRNSSFDILSVASPSPPPEGATRALSTSPDLSRPTTTQDINPLRAISPHSRRAVSAAGARSTLSIRARSASPHSGAGPSHAASEERGSGRESTASMDQTLRTQCKSGGASQNNRSGLFSENTQRPNSAPPASNRSSAHRRRARSAKN